MTQKRSIKDLIDGLVDKDGIKTEVTVTLTNQTLTKNLFPNHQIASLQADIKSIKSTLKSQLK